MERLDKMGLSDCYYVDGDRIYNARTKRYINPIGKCVYKLKGTDNKYKNVTMKEIWKTIYNKNYCIDDIEKLDGEIFREIYGTNGKYYVSNLGRIKSCSGLNAIILKPTITAKGYERLQIYIDGVRYSKLVHTIVANEWLNKPDRADYEVHHIDFNKLNNNASNLVWLSIPEHKKIHCERRKYDKTQKSKIDNHIERKM